MGGVATPVIALAKKDVMVALFATPLLLGLGAQEMWILLAVVILVFGASKLPELARGSGQALRIFKAETRELREGDKAENAAGETAEGVKNVGTDAERPTDSAS